MLTVANALPSNLCVAIPLKKGQEAQLRLLLDALALLPCHILDTVEAVGDSMAGEHQVDQVLAAVAMCGYEASVWLIHITPGLPAEAWNHEF